MEEKLLNVLESQGIPMKKNELMERSGLSEEAFGEILARLEFQGKLVYTSKGKVALPQWLGYLAGTLSGNQRGFGFLVPDDKNAEDVFLPSGALMGAMHQDRILVKVRGSRAYRGKKEGEVVRVLSRARDSVVGRLERGHNAGFLVPEDRRIPDVFIPLENMGDGRNGDLVVAQIVKWPSGNRNAVGKVAEVLGKSGSSQASILGIVRSSDLPDTFTKGALAQSKGVPQQVDPKQKRGREDYRGLTTVTIDGADAKDLDDAVSLEDREDGYILYVHIADVSHYVTPGCPMDQDAYERGTSVYFPGQVIPMLPEALSNGICSLNAGVDRLALSCRMELDRQGNIKSYSFHNSVIHVDKRCTYEDVSQLLEKGITVPGYEGVADLLLRMGKLSEILSRNRHARGSIDFDLAETDIETDDMGNAVDIRRAQRGRANAMIEDFMLSANECAAAYGSAWDLPFLYRVHEEPDQVRMEELFTMAKALGLKAPKLRNIHPKALQVLLREAEDTPYASVMNRTMLRCMKKARYADAPLGHFGLALKNYCHFTSPIRRYPDLVVHRAIKAAIGHGPGCKELEAMEEKIHAMGEHTSARERVAMEAERAVDDLLKAQYMERFIGQRFTGVITSVVDFGIFVELPNTAEGLIRMVSLDDDYYVYDEKMLRLTGKRTKKTFAIGDEMDIIVSGVNLDMRRVEFVPAEGGGR